jgi:hypothetical protein
LPRAALFCIASLILCQSIAGSNLLGSLLL